MWVLIHAGIVGQWPTYLAYIQQQVPQVALFHEGQHHIAVPFVNRHPSDGQDIRMVKPPGDGRLL